MPKDELPFAQIKKVTFERPLSAPPITTDDDEDIVRSESAPPLVASAPILIKKRISGKNKSIEIGDSNQYGDGSFRPGSPPTTKTTIFGYN